VLSRVLPLESFGYYALATNAAASVALISAPFFATTFPRFSSLVAAGDESALRVVYHQACQLLSVILLPFTVALIVFARQVLLVWTGNPMIAENAALPMALLAAGFALNALHNLPYALQLAHGWTTLAITENSIAVVLLIPLAIYAGRNYGGAGAAAVWLLLNVFYATISIWIMHRRYLRGELLHWYRYDVGAPLLATIIVLVPAAFVAPATGSRIVLFLWLAVTTTAAAVLAVLLTPHPRAVAKDYWSRFLAVVR
jgi:O-antigen/teichoic acid export membrane protein